MCDTTNPKTTGMCRWLRDNSSGSYRKAAEAATMIEELETALRNIVENSFYATTGYQHVDRRSIDEARKLLDPDPEKS